MLAVKGPADGRRVPAEAGQGDVDLDGDPDRLFRRGLHPHAVKERLEVILDALGGRRRVGLEDVARGASQSAPEGGHIVYTCGSNSTIGSSRGVQCQIEPVVQGLAFLPAQRRRLDNRLLARGRRCPADARCLISGLNQDVSYEARRRGAAGGRGGPGGRAIGPLVEREYGADRDVAQVRAKRRGWTWHQCEDRADRPGDRARANHYCHEPLHPAAQ